MIRVRRNLCSIFGCNLTRFGACYLVGVALSFAGTPAEIRAQEDQVVHSENSDSQEPQRVIVVVGAPGNFEYAQEFTDLLQAWRDVAQRAGWTLTVVGSTQPIETKATDKQRVREAIAAQAVARSRLWLVLLGHGTSAAGEAKFNLVGPDLSATELSTWLAPLACPLVVVNCSSASAPFLPALSGPERVVITATRSGNEINFARFGKYFVQAMADLSTDVDHDLTVSLLEVFLSASVQTERFYSDQSRLTTEHALLDDNADRVGSSSDFFQAGRAVRLPQGDAQVDGANARRISVLASPDAPQFSGAQLLEREQLEHELSKLRGRRAELGEKEYYSELEVILLKLAELYAAAEPAQ